MRIGNSTLPYLLALATRLQAIDPDTLYAFRFPGLVGQSVKFRRENGEFEQEFRQLA